MSDRTRPTSEVTTRPTVPEQPGPPAAETGEARPPEPLRRRKPRRQSAFRRWRKTRPFWGGLFTMLAGAEIAGLTALSYELILISRSVAFAIAVGGAIAAFGLTMWLSPALSKLLGLLTLVAALLSFVAANLGGFLLGMLLAILGGGLCFAWEPGHAPAEPILSEPAPDDADEPEASPAEETRVSADDQTTPLVPGQRPPAQAEEFERLDRFFEG